MRTNPKSGTSGNAKSGSVLPRATRRRAVKAASPESAVLTPVSEEAIQNEIAQLAYFFWEARGGNGGSSEEDWLRAEQEILARSRS